MNNNSCVSILIYIYMYDGTYICIYIYMCIYYIYIYMCIYIHIYSLKVTLHSTRSGSLPKRKLRNSSLVQCLICVKADWDKLTWRHFFG